MVFISSLITCFLLIILFLASPEAMSLWIPLATVKILKDLLGRLNHFLVLFQFHLIYAGVDQSVASK